MASTITSNPSVEPSLKMLLDEAILTRHSTRLFLPKPVPESTLNEALELATHAPSNSNTQAWRLFLVTGAALDRLKTSLRSEAASGATPNIPALPENFKHFRTELGRLVYGEGWGIPHGDAEARRQAVLRNFEFFGAPVAAIVCMSRELPEVAALSVGMYLQTFLLGLTARGVGSCVEVSIAGYRDLVRREIGVPEDLQIICGIAVGYEDGDCKVNKVRSLRNGFGETTVWVRE